ncbi:MAG: hypothetical protein L3J89_03885 [Gammaproteobacteria bacterium]|nr:hypothetical protein [Gammaproteobacteria bacterium]
MMTIESNFIQAQLSMAAYSLDLRDGMFGTIDTTYTAALVSAGMSQKQAEEFADTYTVVEQYSDPGGFSGTVFSKGDVNYLAIRGSEALFTSAGNVDWFGTNFGDVGGDGVAIDQGLAMFNWVQRLYGASGSAVVQYTYNTDGTMSTYTDFATGELSGQTTPITVAGHSLGGHLAMMLGRMAPGMFNDVYTYNSPGFDVFGTDPTSSGFFDLFNSVPVPLTGSIGTDWNTSGVNTNVESDLVHLIGDVPGISGIIFSESNNQGPLDSHDIVAMTDSLAVYNLFATLDSNLNTDPNGINTITSFIENSTYINANSLETTIDMLSGIFGVTGNVAIDDRDALYTQIQAIEASGLFTNSVGAVSIVDVNSLANAAMDNSAAGYAYRYALVNLNPFAITGNAGLYLSSEWGADNFTEQFLLDKAYVLNQLISRNSIDHYLVPTTDGRIEYYDDQGSNIQAGTFDFGSTILPSAVRYTFGDENPDTINGGNQGDYLYGGAGNDIISGNAGADYIEGNAGTDTLLGGAGNDTLLGGTGDDILSGDANDDNLYGGNDNDVLNGGGGTDRLYGGAGDDILIGGAGDNVADVLEGGTGMDTYIFNSGDGSDLIRDTDGLGQIIYDGNVLIGGLETATANEYQNDDGSLTYRLNGNFLQIIGVDGVVSVENFNNGDLGINLIETPEPVATTTITTFIGNEDALQIDGMTASNFNADLAGADPLTPNQITLASNIDAVYVGDQNDFVNVLDIANNPGIQLYGGEGNDTLSASSQTDSAVAGAEGAYLYGEGGNDTLVGSSRVDWLVGGLGHDYLDGGGAEDILLGMDGNDLLFGEDGQDYLYGSAGNDWLYGGAGIDTLVGGTGNDTLFGDTESGVIATWDGANEAVGFFPANAYWTYTESVLALNQTQDVAVTEVGDDILFGGDGNDAIFGGGGNDQIYGGRDDDQLYGEAGDDLFLYTEGDGFDRVNGGDGIDTLQGSAGDDTIGLSTFSGSNTVEVIDGGAGSNIIQNNNYSNTLDFSGTTLVNIAAIYGMAGNDSLTGSTGNDTLVGGSGNDTLSGGAGSDVYIFGRGDGSDVVNDYNAQDAQPAVYGATEDMALFGADISTEQLWFSRNGDNLNVSVIGTADQLVVSNWYGDDAYQVDRFEVADGAYLLDTQVDQLVSAMAAFNPPALGELTLSPDLQTGLQPVIAAAWQNVA